MTDGHQNSKIPKTMTVISDTEPTLQSSNDENKASIKKEDAVEVMTAEYRIYEDSNLAKFPTEIFEWDTQDEINLTCNKIKTIPLEIGKPRNLKKVNNV